MQYIIGIKIAVWLNALSRCDLTAGRVTLDAQAPHEHPSIRPVGRMRRGLKRPNESDDRSESASVNSQTVQLEGLDASEVVDVTESDVGSLFWT